MDKKKLLEIFRYMSMGCHRRLKPADGAIVFCREDPVMAAATALLFKRKLITWALLTGGIGKDSGSLKVPEAVHQKALLVKQGVPESMLYLEPTATNGAENSRFAIDLIRREKLPHKVLFLVVHPNSARRVYAVHTFIARKEKRFRAQYQVVCAEHKFDPYNLADQREVIREFLRVADWPTKVWSDPQPDQSLALVEWARGVEEGAPVTTPSK